MKKYFGLQQLNKLFLILKKELVMKRKLVNNHKS